MEQPLISCHANANGGDQNKRTFQPAGEIFSLAMPKMMLIVRRLGGEGEHRQRHDRRHQIDHGLHRIGQ